MQNVSSERPAPIDSSLLAPTYDANELQRRELQLGLLRGWAHWVGSNMLDHVLLPSAARFRSEVCHLPTGVCLNQTMIGRCVQPDVLSSPPNSIPRPHALPHMRLNRTLCACCVEQVVHPQLRAGAYAADRSYMQLYISWMTVNVSLSYSVSGADHEHLMMLVEPAQCTGTVCDDYVVRMVGNYAYSRAGSVEAVSERQLHYEPWGLPSADLFVVTSKSSAALDGDQYKARHARHATQCYKPQTHTQGRSGWVQGLPPTDGPFVVLPLNQGPIGLATTSSVSVSDIQNVLAKTK